jgi:hypothetical protein
VLQRVGCDRIKINNIFGCNVIDHCVLDVTELSKFIFFV